MEGRNVRSPGKGGLIYLESVTGTAEELQEDAKDM